MPVSSHRRRQGIIPPYLLDQLQRRGPAHLGDRVNNTRQLTQLLRERRSQSQPAMAIRSAVGDTAVDRRIYDAHNATSGAVSLVRSEGAPSNGDVTVDEAYDYLGATHALFLEVYGRNSIDDNGMVLTGIVHYGENYDNAYWDGQQMVFGDGDGEVFNRFTIAVDVVGHELTHGVTEHTAGLEYQDQPGALNESISDVFGSLVKQYANKQTAAEADWLIGAGMFTDAINGVALRSLKAPGTAYDDPLVGKDPQPSTMDGYFDDPDDNGGVHSNSGIPNHAFYLAATSIGGYAWEKAGRVWYRALTGGELAADADFASFAALTVRVAEDDYGADSSEAEAIRQAWTEVGVTVDVTA